ncbi:MAG TPA: PKD domain-containing protein, partial [Euryarchaeota archaeon]|nr:PKD domain-containing protein [Euryarchaeota archaeon]
CDWDPETITRADVIIQAPHGHMTHYDADEVATVAKNTGAYLVGNSKLKSDMTARGISSSKIFEVSPTMGGKASTSITSLGLTIHSYGMEHTGFSGLQVNTFFVEMPSGITWYHGTCSSGTNTMNTMSKYPELKGVDVMICDTDMNFNTLNSQYYPETLIKDHDYNSPSPIPATVYENYPSTLTKLYHNQTYRYIRPDYQPGLYIGDVDPDEGTLDTEFEFSVLYKYRPDTAPSKAELILDGGRHELTTTDTTFRTGALYKFTTTLMEGAHSFHFEFEADGKTARFPTEGELKKPIVNHIPLLGSNSVDPAKGTDDMDYTFSVIYSDADGDAPGKYDIFIDGERHSMRSSEYDYVGGATFTYTTFLSVGNHSYHFEFSDEKNDVRLPETGEFQGPDVERANYPPSLYAGTVEPLKGDRLDTFTFSVGYRDTHGDRPSRAQLFMDGTAYNMSTDDVNFKTGVKYEVKIGLGLGVHEYHFEFEEGAFTVRFPPGEDELVGPNVENLDPEAKIASPLELDEFSTDVPVVLNGSLSTDPEGDDLLYNWSSNIDGFLGEGDVIEVLFTEGYHLITLTVDDGLGGISTDEVQIMVVEYKPIIDLRIGMVPASPTEGSDARIEATISNLGNLASNEIEVKIMMDGQTVKNLTIDSLAPGTKHVIKYGFRSMGGDHTVHVILTGPIDDWFNFTIIERPPPIANAGEDRQVNVGDTLTFDGSGSTSNGIIEEYLWDFGNTTLLGMIVTFTFDQPGTFNVSLTVTDDLGRSSSDVVKVEVMTPADIDTSLKDTSRSNNGLLIAVIISGLILVLILIGTAVFILKRKGNRSPPLSGQYPQPSSPSMRDGEMAASPPVRNGPMDNGPPK